METQLKIEILRIAEANSNSLKELKEKVKELFVLFNVSYPYELSPKE